MNGQKARVTDPALTEMVSSWLEQNHITKSELARRLGISRQTLNGWFKRDSFYPEELKQIAKVTGGTLTISIESYDKKAEYRA